MSNKTEKPYVLRAAEFVYTKIIDIKKQNPEVNNIQAFEIFITTKEFEILSSFEFHDRWFLDRVCTHILAFEGISHVEWFEGNYEAYEADKKSRLGADATQLSRIRYKPIKRN